MTGNLNSSDISDGECLEEFTSDVALKTAATFGSGLAPRRVLLDVRGQADAVVAVLAHFASQSRREGRELTQAKIAVTHA
ncbi:hypothetical protein ACFY05_27085 [Microtetraspora fusca]|uniref:Uncharacterized protein n=1 Tax=Microtetraspora fusca TaxID=1997 RepID=A0ABW6VB35_MICFU